MVKNPRKPLSKRIRFEVFKRDSFTCKYCRRNPAEHGVVLVVDHVDPVSLGGSNDPLNLVTACEDCNGGKSNIRLSDSEVLKRTTEELEKAQERKNQIQEMVRWRKSLIDTKNAEVDAFCDFWTDVVKGYGVSECGRASAKKWIKDFSLDECLAAASVAAERYVKFSVDGFAEIESVITAFDKIPRIAALERMEKIKPGSKDIAYIKGILRNKFQPTNYKMMDAEAAIANAVNQGISYDEIKRAAASSYSINGFIRQYEKRYA